MADLLDEDYSLVEKNSLYRCLDKVLQHKEQLLGYLRQRWQDLFGARFEVLLYDLTSTYFESDPVFEETDKRQFGYSRDKRSDCVQVVIALIITPEGFPLAYEVLPGNTSDKTTLGAFLSKIEEQYGKAERVWLMDRGIPTEEVLSEMPLKRSAHLLPGRNSQGSAEQTGSRSIGTSLAERTSRGRSQSLAPRRGTLPFGPESGSTQQGAGDAPAPAQSFMEALGSTPEDETQSRGASTEVGRSKGALPGCLAFSRLPTPRGHDRGNGNF